jgi:hypothetical protein
MSAHDLDGRVTDHGHHQSLVKPEPAQAPGTVTCFAPQPLLEHFTRGILACRNASYRKKFRFATLFLWCHRLKQGLHIH